MAVIDVKTMTEFSSNLGLFNKAMHAANIEIESLLNKPGIQSEEITAELTSLRNKLNTLQAKWDELADDFNKHLNVSMEEAEKLHQNIQATLNTNE